MPDRSIWEGAPPDLDRRIGIARRLLDLAESWDLRSDDPDTEDQAAAALQQASEELRAVVRRSVL